MNYYCTHANGLAILVAFRDDSARVAAALIEELASRRGVLIFTDWPHTTLDTLKPFGLRRDFFDVYGE